MFNAALIGVSGFGDVHYRDLMRETEAGRLRPVAALARIRNWTYRGISPVLHVHLFRTWKFIPCRRYR